MAAIIVVIVSLIYIFALLFASFFNIPNSDFSWSILIFPSLIYGSLGLISAFIIPRFWRRGPRFFFWLFVPLVAIFATVYLQLRYPQPTINDISNFIPPDNPLVTVRGSIINNPTLNDQNNIRFLFKVKGLNNSLENVSGKLYVTLPLLQGNGLTPRQNLTITGFLYEPQSNLNPGGFDFQKYLNQQGVFAGLKGVKVEEYSKPVWGFWILRKRIIKSQIHFLNSPVGPLVSSLVLGRKSVDLPPNIRDNFIQVGLAHVLAASGFHVALLLGTLLKFINNFSPKNKLIIGSITLIFYAVLTGGQPSILRASIMGFATLIGLVTEKKLRRLNFLVFTAFLLLIIQPFWINDLSFQFSFLAVFGLIITAPNIINKLDFLPPTIANLIAIPVSATIWVLPVSIYVFNSVSIYSILVNILTTFLVAIISLVAMLSAFSALFFPFLGSIIAGVLSVPTLVLINIVNFFVTLPYSYLAIGQINLFQLIVIYSILILVWLSPFFAKRWYFFAIFIISLIVIPIINNNLNLTQITVFSAPNEPIIIIQNKGKNALITSYNYQNKKYIIEPFLRYQAINNLPINIDLKNINYLEEKGEYSLNKDGKITVFNDYLEININNQKWWLFDNNLTNNLNPNLTSKNNSPDVILWSGDTKLKWWEIITPKTAIAYSKNIRENLKQELEKNNITLYNTNINGAIKWTPKNGFQSFLTVDN